ncbi:MAG: asparagine synthase-related protein, partial [Bacteroidota bacterium]
LIDEKSLDYNIFDVSKRTSSLGYKIKKDSLDNIIHCNLSDGEIITLGYNEYLSSHNKSYFKEKKISDIIDEIKKADGEYLSVSINSKGIIKIITDRYSSRPCFYAEINNNIYFSSNISFLVSLLPESVTFDPVGVFQMLNLDHTVGGRTTFNEIKRIRPANEFEINDGVVVKKETYWSVKYKPDPINDYKEFAGKVFHEMVESIRKRTSNKEGFMSLSGGLDSRLIACAVDKKRFNAFTFVNSLSESNTREVKVAKQVARKLGINHRVKAFDGRLSIFDVIEDVIQLTGGQVAVHHSAKVMEYIKEIQRHGFHLGGGPGDTLAGAQVFTKKVDFDEKAVDEFVNHKLKYPAVFLKKISTNKGDFDLIEKLRSSIKESFSGLNEKYLPQLVSAWGLRERQPAFTLTSPIHNHPVAAESSPHLGYKYTDLMLQLSANDIIKKNFYKFLIYHNSPKLRKTAYANTGMLLSSDLIERYYPQSYFNKLRLLFGKIKIIAKKHWGKLKPGYKIPFHYQYIKQDVEILESTRSLLKNNSSLNKILNTQECINFIEGFQSGKIVFSYENDANIIGFLITMSYTQKHYNVK